MQFMVADGRENTQSDGLEVSFATKAQLADYLESQADILAQLAKDDPGAHQRIWEIAARFAEVARAHELEFVASRFDRFKPSAATGTNGE
jgi:hypothetical protein